ncbi:MAG: T9SS type A sorting domain-containing protein [Flavobacteriales bacterium]
MLRIILSFTVCFIASSFAFSKTITHVSPNSGTQGTLSLPITITGSGTNFSSGTITNVSPNSGTQGTLSLPITITGSGTNFSSATSTLVQVISSNGNGSTLQVLNITSLTPTSVSVDIAVSNTAFVGAYTVKVYDQSVGNFISLSNGFTVIASSLELDAPQLPKLSVYPNPTNGELNIELPNNLENAKLMIFNQMGQLVLEETLNSSIGKLFTTNINHLSSGIYVVRLLGNNNASESRLIKK